MMQVESDKKRKREQVLDSGGSSSGGGYSSHDVSRPRYTAESLMEAFESCSAKDQETFLAQLLTKREDEKRMFSVKSKNNTPVCYWRLAKVKKVDPNVDPYTVSSEFFACFRTRTITPKMLSAIITCIGGNEKRGAYLLARLLGNRHKESAERGMIDSGSIVKKADEKSLMEILPRQYYTEQHFASYSRPIMNLSKNNWKDEARITTTSDSPLAKTKCISSIEARSWLFDYFRGMRPEDKLDNYYTRCLEVVLSDPEVSKLFHPKHISGPLRFKQAATPVVKWLKEVDTYAIYPHWYKRSSFGIPKDKYYQQAEVFLEVETTNNHNCDLVVSLGEHDGEDINRSEEEVEYHDDDE